MKYQNDIKEYLNLEIDTINKLDINALSDAINLFEETRINKKRIFTMGNGGSASTASHMVNDFSKGISEYILPKYRMTCLNDNISTIMAIANDISYDEIFKFQLKDIMEPGDVVIAISGSGNSKNVLLAAEYAKMMGNKVVSFTGFDGGMLMKYSDISLNVPINSMQITEDIHLIFDHLIMSILYKYVCNKNHLINSNY